MTDKEQAVTDLGGGYLIFREPDSPVLYVVYLRGKRISQHENLDAAAAWVREKRGF